MDDGAGLMGNPAITQIGFLLIFIVIMYLLLIRPQRKKERQINEMRNSVQVGDEIVTIGGICGTVIRTKGEQLTIQVGSDKVKFDLMRWGISKIVDSSGRTATSKRKRFEDEEDDVETDEVRKSTPKRMIKKSSSGDSKDADDDEK